jgi:hypothetical protein
MSCVTHAQPFVMIFGGMETLKMLEGVTVRRTDDKGTITLVNEKEK